MQEFDLMEKEAVENVPTPFQRAGAILFFALFMTCVADPGVFARIFL